MYKDLESIESYVTGLDALKQSIKNIILTPIGSLPGNPFFGSNIYKIVFAPLDPLTKRLIKTYIIEALNRFEPRITVKSVESKIIDEYNKIIITTTFLFSDLNFTTEEISDSISVSINL